MIVKIEGKEMTFQVPGTEVSEIFKTIRWELNKKNRVISSILADGQEVFNDIETYVEKRPDLREILVRSATREELARENMDLAAHHLESIAAHLPVIGKDFRSGVSPQGWEDFEGVVQSLIFIEKVIVDIFSTLKAADKKVLTEKWGNVVTEYQKLNPMMKDLEEYLDYDRLQEAATLIDKDMKEILEKVLRLIDGI